jgi:hypothetical protein
MSIPVDRGNSWQIICSVKSTPVEEGVLIPRSGISGKAELIANWEKEIAFSEVFSINVTYDADIKLISSLNCLHAKCKMRSHTG